MGIEDNGIGGARTSRVIKIIITALSILVGFTWEHCFHGGVEAVASVFENPSYSQMMQLFLTAFVALVIIPAWRRYILVKVIYCRELREARKQAQEVQMREVEDEHQPLTGRSFQASESGSDGGGMC